MSIIEYGISAYFHCGETRLEVLDGIQTWFLKLFGICPRVAFLKHHLAPLKYRRLWSMYGLLYKIATRTAPPLLNDLFELVPPARYVSRFTRQRHRLCLQDPRGKVKGRRDLFIYTNSIFGLVSSFNQLPSSMIDVSDIHAFQRALQNDLKQQIRDHPNIPL